MQFDQRASGERSIWQSANDVWLIYTLGKSNLLFTDTLCMYKYLFMRGLSCDMFVFSGFVCTVHVCTVHIWKCARSVEVWTYVNYSSAVYIFTHTIIFTKCLTDVLEIIIVRYHEYGSKKLNACILLLSHIVYL